MINSQLRREENYVMKALHDVVHEVIYSKSEGIAIDLNKSLSSIHKYGEDPNGSGSPIPGNLIVPLSKSAGDASIVDYLAMQLGLVTYRLPEPNLNLNTNHLSRTVKEFSDFLTATSEAEADGNITANEMRKIEREFPEAVSAMLTLCANIRSKVKP